MAPAYTNYCTAGLQPDSTTEPAAQLSQGEERGREEERRREREEETEKRREERKREGRGRKRRKGRREVPTLTQKHKHILKTTFLHF